MGWEWRTHGDRRYGPYYISTCGSRQYLGHGPEAAHHAALDSAQRAAREARRAEQKQLQALDNDVQALHEMVRTLVRGYFLVAGYHQHHRHEWRRHR